MSSSDVPAKENLVYASASHDCGVVMRDGAAAPPENLDIVRAFFAQKIDHGREKFDVPTVVTRYANCPHVPRMAARTMSATER